MLQWQLLAFKRLWKANLTSSLVQPLLYMLGLGVGVGALVDRNTASGAALGAASYVAFVAPGLLVTTAMALCAGESMWPIKGGLVWDRSYHAIASTPLDAHDIVGGHAVWMIVRSGIAAGAVAIVLACFTQTRSWGLVPAVLVCALVGLAFALPIMAYSVTAKTDGSFAAVQRFVIIPLFLFGGAFYPLSQLPVVVQWVARVFPLWHGVVVARGFTLGGVGWAATAQHLGYIALWVVVGGVVATWRLTKVLYT